MNPRRASSILLLLAALAATGWAGSPEESAAALNEKGVRLAESGRLVEAVDAFEAALKASPRDAVIQRNLGRSEANLGVALLEKGELLSAEQATRRAVELLPEDATIRLNLAACLDERGYPARAAAEVRKAVALDDASARGHDRMAAVHQREGRLAQALEEWEKAGALAPGDRGIATRLAQARASVAAESRLAHQVSAHFECLFDMERDAVLASKVLQTLEEAQGIVAADLQRNGQDRLVVVLLPTEEFQLVTGAHGWVAGLYDGRIRLPVKDVGQRESELLARARHEYIHSVLSPLGRRAPGWLHEGLAQVFEGRSAAQAVRRAGEQPAIAYDALADTFAATRSAERARLLYDTALGFVAWLRDGVRGASFRLAMAALFDDRTLDEAFRAGYDAKLSDLYEKFQASVRR